MQEISSLFEPILDDNETIISAFKPNKLKMFFGNIFLSTLIVLFFAGGMCLGMFAPEEGSAPLAPIFALIPAGFFIIWELITILVLIANYKKTAYAVTNKRIIIRTGVIGVDYKSLDMAMIGAIDVYVSFLDKLLGKNTGTIRYGSTSSPISAQNGSMYVFKHLADPYKNCKEIKVTIDQFKNNKQN